MIQTFEQSGVRFKFPANWAVESEEADDGWTVSVHSPDTAFLLVSLRPDAVDPSRLADETLTALRAEYTELDAEPAQDTVAGQPAVGHDIDFVTIDTAITCRTRCLDTAAGPLLVMTQVSEYDRGRNDPVLRAVVASLEVED